MAARRKPSKRAPSGAPRGRKTKPARKSPLTVRRVRGEEAWELVHSPAALERSDDLAEVRRMIDAGETEVAKDELRWLLEGCRDLVAAHRMLGEIALEEGDLALARAHFGYAYQLGVDALPADGLQGTLPHRRPANEAFLESAKGLAGCLQQLQQHEKARGVLERMLALDPNDPLGAAAMLGRA